MRVEGSEDFVPQQDSNSHARSPGKEIILEFMHETEYDEESMIGGYCEPFEWFEEDKKAVDGSVAGDGGTSVYLRSGSPVSVYSSSSLDLASANTVSVS